MDKITPEKAMKELTMVLIYLSRFNEDSRFSSGIERLPYQVQNGNNFSLDCYKY